ncbi:tripartite motif-containing protein 66 isoform X2 [Halichoeres trimaculatus]|uniref:tripartite motif-containing protein 66 isoform X2 n=1 Tax=Halichoeres trimaculatus TaxID=147232 RepID=UPI003D9E5ED2
MEKSCSECSEPTLAQSLCTLCNKWLCYQCTDVHQHQKASSTPQYTDLHQQLRPSAPQCPDLHQRGSSSLPSTGQGPGSYPCPLLMCHSHRQEPLELFCESCDLLCCSSCHLSSHKTHRVVQIGKALQDQQWLFESLMVQVEEKRSAVENNAKQIEDRLHGVKIAHRKAENQIKMAKMIMMNELNKRATLLIEQLEKISEDFQQRLEDQLQGAIEACSQLDHVQKFITWAKTHHCRGPVLFSRALISLQMQQLVEPSLHSDPWSPVKIKFNWDASYWTKQISTLGQLNVEGGNCTYPQGLSCSNILRPQPLTCMTLPTVCHRGREPGCGYQACCEPQMCCLHGIPSQPDLSSLDKSQLEATLYNSSCVQPALISSLHQSQQLQRCWEPDSSTQCPPPSSPIPIMGNIQLNCNRGTASQPQASLSQSQSKSYLYHQHQREILQDSQTLQSADHSRPGQCQRRLSTSSTQQQDPSHTAVDRDVMTEESWEDRCRVEEDDGGTAVESRELLDEELQEDRREQSPVQQQLHVHPELRKEQQRNRAALMLRDNRDGRYATVDPKQRRASDGVLCVVKESSSEMPPYRRHRSPLLSYKTEPEQFFTYVNEEVDLKTKEKCRVSRNSHNSKRDDQKDSGRPKVPVVCLERLKILVSQLPPHGRRQSDPLPASGTEKSNTLSPENTWCDTSQSSPPQISSEFDNQGRISSHKTTTLLSTDPKYVAQSYSALDLDSDSDPRSVSEDAVFSWEDPEQQQDSDPSPESDPHAESSSEVEEKSEAAGEIGLCGEADIAEDSEPSLDYEVDPGSDDGQQLDADTESGDGGTGSDVQPEYDPRFQTETDSDIASDQPPDSQGSVESELDLDSDRELTTDDPQPLRSDLEEDSHISPAQRQLLIANPSAHRGTEDDQLDQDSAAMESEDFCAVCLIGGDLLCCDRCPKVFHLSCHIPSLLSFPSGDWVCSLCRDAMQPEVEYDCENTRTSGEHAATLGLTECDQRKCERLTLLILSNILSAPFHEPVSPLARHYYQIIKRPMDLSVIRAKLNKRNTRHYSSVEHFVADVYLMFRNCAKFNYPDSEVAQAGRSLESFFTSRLKEVFPDQVFPGAEADSDSDEYDEAYRTAEGGFPWPEKREQCHRKRKRRHSLKSRRNNF